MSKPGSTIMEIRVACAMVPNRCENVPVRVLNLASYPVTLAEGAVLTELEPVNAIYDIKSEFGAPSEVVPMELGDRDALNEYVQEFIKGVVAAVLRAIRRALVELLLQYPATFSMGEKDLIRATAVRHRIETERNRPFRQACVGILRPIWKRLIRR